jgi:3-oxoadipate enol-lactonase
MPFVSCHGVDIHYRLDGPADAPVLLFSNSLGTSLSMWDAQADALAGMYRVLRYDTRGHGGSSVPPGPYSVAQLGGDVVHLLDHLGIARAHMCGLSMGGITAMWLAIHHRDRIDHLVLSNTAAYIGPPGGWASRAAAVERDGVASIAPAVVARWLTPAYAWAHAAQVASLQSMLAATSRTGYAASCLALRDNDLRGEVAAIRAPTLVISGAGDLPTPPGDGHYLAAQIPGARYAELPAAHLSNQECPDAFLRLLNDFLPAP